MSCIKWIECYPVSIWWPVLVLKRSLEEYIQSKSFVSKVSTQSKVISWLLIRDNFLAPRIAPRDVESFRDMEVLDVDAVRRPRRKQAAVLRVYVALLRVDGDSLGHRPSSADSWPGLVGRKPE